MIRPNKKVGFILPMPRERAFYVGRIIDRDGHYRHHRRLARHDARFTLEHGIPRKSADRRFPRSARGVADDRTGFQQSCSHTVEHPNEPSAESDYATGCLFCLRKYLYRSSGRQSADLWSGRGETCRLTDVFCRGRLCSWLLLPLGRQSLYTSAFFS